MATQRLAKIFQDHTELDSDVCSKLVALHERKLWHELSLELVTLFKSPDYQPYIAPIFNDFIVDFGQKMKLIIFAQFVHDVAKTLDRDAAVELLAKHVEGIRALKGYPTKEPILFLEMSMAEHFIDVAHMEECKERLDKGLQDLERLSDVDPVVSASVHRVAAAYAKARQDFSGYYRTALQYLCYVSMDELSQDERIGLARDISLAALLGDSIFSFAELLLHPVMNALDGTSYTWLKELLLCFSNGDMAAYDAICAARDAEMRAQPALVAASMRLSQKIRLMCLVALVASLPPAERKLPLATIAARTKLAGDGVEFLLMRAMSLGLVTGTIDEIAGMVDIRHVQPRVLTPAEIAGLKEHVGAWMAKVDGAAALLDTEGISAIEAMA